MWVGAVQFSLSSFHELQNQLRSLLGRIIPHFAASSPQTQRRYSMKIVQLGTSLSLRQFRFLQLGRVSFYFRGVEPVLFLPYLK